MKPSSAHLIHVLETTMPLELEKPFLPGYELGSLARFPDWWGALRQLADLAAPESWCYRVSAGWC